MTDFLSPRAPLGRVCIAHAHNISDKITTVPEEERKKTARMLALAVLLVESVLAVSASQYSIECTTIGGELAAKRIQNDYTGQL